MKIDRMLVALFVVAVASGVVFAENPDQRLSVGLNLNNSFLSGDASANIGAATGSQDVKDYSTLIVADVRWPVTDDVTLSFALGGRFDSQSGSGSGNSSDYSARGLVTGIGARYYFAK